jgi:penicillin-binding protein 1A
MLYYFNYRVQPLKRLPNSHFCIYNAPPDTQPHQNIDNKLILKVFLMKNTSVLLRFFALICSFGLCALLLLLSGMYLYLAPKLPSVERLREVKMQVPLRVYSKNLKLIGEFGEKRRIPVTLKETPPVFIKAVLAAEDDRFYSHGGVDIQSLLRAVTQLVSRGEIQTGGSTITMQVARNFFLSSNQTFARKFNEILLALQIERELSKDEILELYINKIYLGSRAYGIGAAAQVYYGKKVGELSLAQLALIAGLPKAPSTNNPLSNPEKARIRRDWILSRMLKLGYIDQPQYDSAIAEPVIASYHELPLDTDAPYVAEMARQFALDRLGDTAYTDGYQIITTVDEQLQFVAQQSVERAAFDYDKRHGYRGAEKNISSDQISGNNNLQTFLSTLEQIHPISTALPGIILERNAKTLTVLIATSEQISLSWVDIQNSWTRYVDEDHTKPLPEKPTDLFKIGDLIRVTRRGTGAWELSQVPQVQAAMVSLNPDNGAIISLVGGFNFQQSKYNRIFQANRQPGSNFKPFFYTTALENGFTAASLINDSPLVFDDKTLENTWRPENAGDEFLGPIRLRKALYNSRNLVSIRLLKAMGIEKAINGATRFGFSADQLPKNLSLALGSLSVPPIMIATGYASFANGGYKIDPYLIETILDNDNQVIYKAAPLTVCRSCTDENNPDSEHTAAHAQRIIDNRTVFIMDSILKDVIKKGTATKALSLKRSDVAGKTGTTNGPTDVWFSGYCPTLTATTWMGFDNNQNLGKKEYGGSAALPIWIDYMQAALATVPEKNYPQPDGIVTVRIDEKTGLRAKPGQIDALFEFFRSEDVPPETTDKSSSVNNKSDAPLPEDMF